MAGEICVVASRAAAVVLTRLSPELVVCVVPRAVVVTSNFDPEGNRPDADVAGCCNPHSLVCGFSGNISNRTPGIKIVLNLYLQWRDCQYSCQQPLLLLEQVLPSKKAMPAFLPPVIPTISNLLAAAAGITNSYSSSTFYYIKYTPNAIYLKVIEVAPSSRVPTLPVPL